MKISRLALPALLSLLLYGATLPMPMLAFAAPPQPAVAPTSPKLPPLSLTRQFSGPLQDTTIQRFVDTETGVVCYLYTPYVVPNSRTESGQLVYGANNIGSISCVAPWRGSGQPDSFVPKK